MRSKEPFIAAQDYEEFILITCVLRSLKALRDLSDEHNLSRTKEDFEKDIKEILEKYPNSKFLDESSDEQ